MDVIISPLQCITYFIAVFIKTVSVLPRWPYPRRSQVFTPQRSDLVSDSLPISRTDPKLPAAASLTCQTLVVVGVKQTPSRYACGTQFEHMFIVSFVTGSSESPDIRARLKAICVLCLILTTFDLVRLGLLRYFG